jgi:CubicO group peptidase (beta-lactamase class C family)
VLRRRTLLAGTAALACGAAAPAPRRLAETRDVVAGLIRQWRDKLPVVGLSIALVEDGELAWAEGFGSADREAHRPATADTIYAIGSLTKPLTALTALRAAEAGRLDLDAPLRRHLPELRAAGTASITARQILCHRSGLLSDWHRGSLADDPPDWRLIAGEVADEPLLAAPDSWSAYSNVGYDLLGLALERALGLPFTAQVSAAVAALGPANITFEPPPGLAAGYRAGQREPEPRVRHVPAAGAYGSVRDLAVVLRWLLAGEGAAAEMLTPQSAGPLDFDDRWGLGLALRHVEFAHAGRVAWHGGRTLGHHSALIALPDHGLGVAVLANFREAVGVEDLAVAALQTALLERRGVDLPRRIGDAEVAPPAAVDPAELRAHVGRYAGDFDVVDIDLAGAVLESRSALGKTALAPAPGGGFTSAGNRDARVRFVERAGLHVLTSTVRGCESRLAVRCPEEHVPGDWLSRLGRYRVDVAPGEHLAFAAAHLEHDRGMLQLRIELPQQHSITSTLSRYALQPVDVREARIFGVGRGKGQRVRVIDGPDGPALSWAGYRLLRDV